ncbi:hypothetical protein BDD12DRAFT_836765 [Trichophaea hybrida]|nr:hypothetical protein BDD12DRAFT_836765 [Trichophaea hybrida]
MSHTLPPALTSSAREARFSFYCTLCSKGYQRIHEFEAHENSYDHQHKKRFQEMKAMQKPTFTRTTDDNGGIKSISLVAEKKGKKGGFKSAFGGGKVGVKKEEEEKEIKERVESESEDEEDAYDPARPTGI